MFSTKEDKLFPQSPKDTERNIDSCDTYKLLNFAKYTIFLNFLCHHSKGSKFNA